MKPRWIMKLKIIAARMSRLSVMALACAAWAAQAGAGEATLRLGVAAVNEGLLPIRVAIDQGYFASEGLAVELVDFRGGGPAVQAFVGGGVDFCICASDHVLRLASRGLD